MYTSPPLCVLELEVLTSRRGKILDLDAGLKFYGGLLSGAPSFQVYSGRVRGCRGCKDYLNRALECRISPDCDVDLRAATGSVYGQDLIRCRNADGWLAGRSSEIANVIIVVNGFLCLSL